MDKKNIVDLYPLSPMQQGMLFHSIYAPESGVYIEQAALALHGALRVTELQRTWQFVVDRHAILRTGFIWEGVKEPVQVVFRQVEVPFSVLDWRAEDEAAQLEHLQAFLSADRQRGFVMQQAPLLRVTLIRTGEQDWQMVWTHHHILLDGWSVPLLLREVIGVYAAFSRGETIDLPAPRPFRDYISWLRRQDIKACEAYWRRKLAGFTRRTPLGMAKASPELPAAEADFREVEIHLPAAATQALQRLARQQQITLNTIAQSAWAILLSGYSGEKDVVFGTTVSGRPGDLPGAEQILGCFINTLPVRLQVPAGVPVQDWIREVQRQQGELHQYEYSPLAQVQSWSEVTRGQPLFDSLFVFENFPTEVGSEQTGGAMQMRGEQSSSHTNYPLTVVAMPDQEMLLKISYDEQWFDRAAIEQILRHYRQVLVSIAAGPLQPVERLSWIDGPEQQEIAAWSQAARSLDEPFRPANGYVQIRGLAGEPAPVGVPGQVWLQAVGARGVPDAPWTPTGEQARWLPGGELQYLGVIPAEEVFPAQRAVQEPLPLAAALGRQAGYFAPRSEMESTLAAIWSEVLGVGRVGIRDNFFELGGDSILSMQVISRAHQAGIAITPRLLFEHATIEQLSQVLELSQAPQTLAVEQELLSGPSGLLPIQHYFFENYAATLNQFNTSMLLSVGSQLDPRLLELALGEIVAHHDALRLEFEFTPGEVKARYAEIPARLPFWFVDLAGVPAEAQRTRIEQQAGELQQSFDIGCAPLIRMVYFNLGAGSPGRLLIILHHLVSDGVSWRILVPDLTQAYARLSQGQPVQLPPKTSSFRAWAGGLAALAQAPETLGELEHWRQAAAANPILLPVDFPGGENLFGVTTELTVSLSPVDSQLLLRQAAGDLGGQINAILLAGLARALANWTGRQSGRHSLLIEMEGHGREDVLPGLDCSRTVGWFTSIFPQLLQIDLDQSGADQVQAIQGQLDATPRRGLGYGLLRYLNQDAPVRQVMQAIPQPQINFNYLGQFGQDDSTGPGLFHMAAESVGSEQNPQARRSADLYLVAIVNGGQLHTRWLYSQKLHRLATIERIANLYIDELHKLINHIVK